MPLSRFWACFFSCSIFALLWTQKISKTRKWIPMFAMFVSVWFIADYLLYPNHELLISSDEFDEQLFYFEPNQRLKSFMYNIVYSYFPNDNIVFLLSLVLTVLYHFVIFLGVVLINFYFMFKWITQYNLKEYGHKSKKDWKKANLPSRNYGEKIKQFGTKTGANLKDVGTKTGAKISKTTMNLKYGHKNTEEYKRHQIEEWHKLMVMGILSENQFEQKKAEILKDYDQS